jgi:hypothetical protein
MIIEFEYENKLCYIALNRLSFMLMIFCSSGSELYVDDIYADEYCLCLIWVWYILILSNHVLIIKILTN